MKTEELVKRLRDIEHGEGEFPLPDTMIEEIIKGLEELEELRIRLKEIKLKVQDY